MTKARTISNAIRKTFDVESAIFPDVRFGSIQATNVPLLIADLASLSESAGGLDGILGLDLLWGHRIAVDFGSKKLLVSTARTESAQSFRQDEISCVTTTAQIQGFPARLMVDTGLEDILLYHDRVPQLETGHLRPTQLGHSMFVNEVLVKNMRVGTANIEHPNVLLVPKAPAGLSCNVDGVLGTASLKPRWLLLDFSRGTLAWR
jgi:hypothetical protein